MVDQQALGARPTNHSAGATLTRRELLSLALTAGVAVPQGFRRRRFAPAVDPARIPTAVHRTLPMDALPMLQREYDQVRSNPQLSRNAIFRGDIAPLGLNLSAALPGARALIVVAAFARPATVQFTVGGRAVRVVVPFLYYREAVDATALMATLRKEVVTAPRARLVDVSERVPLKLLAARSGLGQYGRNLLIFVEGMGSYNLLYAFLTDQTLPTSPLVSASLLGECRHCHACARLCPTGCLADRSVSIDVDRCITLYNEKAGELPTWIQRSAHHALMGCLRCQTPCPANEGITELSTPLETVSEAETRQILQGASDEALIQSMRRKLAQFPATTSKAAWPILRRNLSVLLTP